MSSNNLKVGDYLANTWRFWQLSGDSVKGDIMEPQRGQKDG